MFSSRNIHFAILGLILGASIGYIAAFYQAEASFVPKAPPQQQVSQTFGLIAIRSLIGSPQAMQILGSITIFFQS